MDDFPAGCGVIEGRTPSNHFCSRQKFRQYGCSQKLGDASCGLTAMWSKSVRYFYKASEQYRRRAGGHTLQHPVVLNPERLPPSSGLLYTKTSNQEYGFALSFKMLGQDLQFQFEVTKAITISAKSFDLLLRVCGEDDVQPMAIPPLELFGRGLMVDSGRIGEGVAALGRRRNATWKPLILISPPKATELVRGNIHLTSTFLFATCCSIIFNVQKTSDIIYEMMILGGAAHRYNITSNVVFRFVELFNGSRDYFVSSEDMKILTPYDLYKALGEDILGSMRMTNTWISNLYEENDAKLLAKLLYTTFEILKDVENEFVELEGSKGGLWVAFAFIWLRPAETTVFVADVCIYPETQSPMNEARPRLLVRLRKNGHPRSESDAEGDWAISVWKGAAHVTEPIKIDNPTEQAGFNPLTSSPWKGARNQIEMMKHSKPVVMAIGHLAGALVQVVTECGLLWNENFSLDKRLLDICAPWYEKYYTTIMKEFGWSENYQLIHPRRENIASAIKTKVNKGDYKDYEDDTKTIGTLIDSCFVDYEKTHQEPMLIHSSEGDHEEDIIEHAIHLAAHAIVSSVFREIPQHGTYWPLQPQMLREHSKLIREMLLKHPITSPQGKSWAGQGVPFGILRSRAIRTAIPSVTAVEPQDLAWAGDGYVAFSSTLSHQEWTDNHAKKSDHGIDLADPRLVGTIEVFPGCLQQKDLPGRFIKLSQDPRHMRTAARLVNIEPNVKFFSEDGNFDGVPESNAYDPSNIEVKYFLRRDDHIRTIFLTTYLETSLDVLDQSGQRLFHLPLSGLRQSVPTSWHRSIDVTMFAEHVDLSMCAASQDQLKALAKGWWVRGIAMQWCRVGTGLLSDACHLAATAGKNECRFFEAGNVREGARVLVRQGNAAIIHCVKIAMDICENGKNWVIIT
jgi:hypothetical protein